MPHDKLRPCVPYRSAPTGPARDMSHVYIPLARSDFPRVELPPCLGGSAAGASTACHSGQVCASSEDEQELLWICRFMTKCDVPSQCCRNTLEWQNSRFCWIEQNFIGPNFYMFLYSLLLYYVPCYFQSFKGKQEAQRATYRAPEYNVPPFWGIGQGGYLFTDQPEKHKLGRGLWDLASCQVLLNSVQRFQRKSRKCLSQSEARAAILFFWMDRKTQTW